MFETPLEMIDDSPVVSLLALIALSCLIGKVMVSNQQRSKRLGYHFAGGGFLFYCFYGWFAVGAYLPEVLLGILWRATIAAGLVLGFSWMILAAMGFLLNAITSQSRHVNSFVHAIGSCLQDWHEHRHRRRELRKQEQLQQLLAPEREREARREQRERNRAYKLDSLRDQKRYELRLLYNRLAQSESPTFAPEVFDEVLADALSPNTANEIEERTAKLQEALAGFSASENTHAEQPHTLEDIVAQYDARRAAVDSMHGLNEDQKERLIHFLNKEQGHQMTKKLREI